MTETQSSRAFVAYEYKNAAVDSRYLSYYMDGYENFGWQCENVVSRPESGMVILNLKRDHRIINKMELTRLQRQFEACMQEIRSLEASKSSGAMAASLAVGVTGTAFMAGSVFAVTAQPPIIWLCVLLAIPAFAGWALALPLYRSMLSRRTAEVEPLIEDKFDEIASICEKAHHLLQ